MATAWLSSLKPIPSLPDYHGPYEVGTVDVEIPTADLPAPCETPEDAQPTIAFRVFYPCVKPSKNEFDRPVRWISQPQKQIMVALMRFLGLGERTAGVLSHFSQQLYWIRLNAHRNARLLDPKPSNGRWPVAFFSHGLAGSRNAYSYVCGDLASNGTIVVALDHRDGSSPIQYVRETVETEAREVPAITIAHDSSDEVWEARDKQLRIRLWEISMAYEAFMKIDAGEKVENLDSNSGRSRGERVEVLTQFDGRLDIHRPGKVSWVGHSFGAATITQLLKSIYYSKERPHDAGQALIKPNADAAISRQIVPESPMLLLDMWCLPLKSPQQAFLWYRSPPSYAIGGPGGDNILSVLSEGFANWQSNLKAIETVIAPPSRSNRHSATSRSAREKGKLLPAWTRLREDSASRDSGYSSQDSHASERPNTAIQAQEVATLEGFVLDKQPKEEKSNGPHMFYVQRSQHFSQSDFGILFPWLASRFTKAEEPERILELNNRAMVQVLRQNGIEVPGKNDPEILGKSDGLIRQWIAIPIEAESEATSNATGKLEIVNRMLSESETLAPDSMTTE